MNVRCISQMNIELLKTLVEFIFDSELYILDKHIYIDKSALPFCQYYFYGLVQERCNSSVLAMELCLCCPNLSI